MMIIHKTATKCIYDWDINKVLVWYCQYNIEPLVYDLLEKKKVITLRHKVLSNNCMILERIGNPWTIWDQKDAGSCRAELFGTLGKWLRSIHNVTKTRDETALDEIESIRIVRESKDISWISKYHDYVDIDKVDTMMNYIRGYLATQKLRLLHNDICYKNILVNNEREKAILFDYDKSGWGLAEQDILALLQRVEQKYSTAFLDSYGAVDNSNLIISKALDFIEMLYTASKCTTPPNWAKDTIWNLKTGKFEIMLSKVREVID